MNFDIAIVGGGPAGISAAIHSARLGLKTILIEKNKLGGAALIAPFVDNYAGFHNGISGKALVAEFLSHLAKWPVEKIFTEASEIDRCECEGINLLAVKTASGDIRCKAAIISTGLHPKILGIPGEIPYGDPDSIPHVGKSVAIIGSGDCAFDLAIAFSKKASEVCINMKYDTPRAAKRLVEMATLNGVKLIKNHTPLGIDAEIVISCAGKYIGGEFIRKSVKNIGREDLRSEGIFTAGDVAHEDVRHISTAVGDGVAAAERAYGYIWK